jgi:hypothetical protein
MRNVSKLLIKIDFKMTISSIVYDVFLYYACHFGREFWIVALILCNKVRHFIRVMIWQESAVVHGGSDMMKMFSQWFEKLHRVQRGKIGHGVAVEESRWNSAGISLEF